MFTAVAENIGVGADGDGTGRNRTETGKKRYEVGEIGKTAGKAALAVTCLFLISAGSFAFARGGRREVKHAGRKKRKQKNIRKGNA